MYAMRRSTDSHRHLLLIGLLLQLLERRVLHAVVRLGETARRRPEDRQVNALVMLHLHFLRRFSMRLLAAIAGDEREPHLHLVHDGLLREAGVETQTLAS